MAGHSAQFQCGKAENVGPLCHGVALTGIAIVLTGDFEVAERTRTGELRVKPSAIAWHLCTWRRLGRGLITQEPDSRVASSPCKFTMRPIKRCSRRSSHPEEQVDRGSGI